uniref:Uncharacterized protein n=1 Tax=Hydrodictyon reticulatum TaxID=3107 RepID=A0A1W5RMZ5_HYDRE|nr:hypothetical protein [Hydrodictyon reticulatum]AQU64567.1 hypothetical protein [Hydrodictyon reticulatum]
MREFCSINPQRCADLKLQRTGACSSFFALLLLRFFSTSSLALASSFALPPLFRFGGAYAEKLRLCRSEADAKKQFGFASAEASAPPKQRGGISSAEAKGRHRLCRSRSKEASEEAKKRAKKRRKSRGLNRFFSSLCHSEEACILCFTKE